MPPPAQRPATQRAAQLPARQLPLDHCPVTVYREHDASKRQPSGPPRGLRQKDNGEGRAKSDALTVPAPAPGCNPATHRPVGKAPPPTQSRSAARPLHPHRHPQRRFPAPAIRILSAVEHLPAREERKERPSLSLRPSPGHAAAEPGARLDAGQDSAPGGGLDARYEQLRHAALHARAQAFPLGLGVLAGKGVTAWQRALASPAAPQPPSGRPPGAAPAHPPALPAPVAAELISALAAVALAGTVPGPAP